MLGLGARRSVRFFLAFAAVSPGGGQAVADTIESHLARCAAIVGPADRLDCFDDVTRARQLDRPAVETRPSGKWRLSTSTSKIDDSRTVTISLDAEDTVKGWLGSARPTLVLRCKENDTDAYVVTGMPPHVEYGNHDAATVVVRFDQAKAVNVNMGKSTSGDALFFEGADAIRYIKTMAEHTRMLFQFTPFNASPVMTEFELTGLVEPLQELRAACGW